MNWRLDSSKALAKILREVFSGSVPSRARSLTKAGPPNCGCTPSVSAGRRKASRICSSVGVLLALVAKRQQTQPLLRDRRRTLREQRLQKPVLGTEMIGDGGEIDVRGRRDCAQADTFHAVLGEHALGHGEDALAHRGTGGGDRGLARAALGPRSALLAFAAENRRNA